MAKIKYASFKDYFDNDKKFFFRVLKDEVYKAQSKIYFADGTTYHVTKAGSRYWEYPGFGWKAEYLRSGTPHQHFYCRGINCTTEDEFLATIDMLKAQDTAIDQEVADVHPVIMTLTSDRWVDPTINDWYEENFFHNDECCYSMLQCLTIKSKDDEFGSDTLQLWFKSDYMTEKVTNYMSRTDKSQQMNQFPYVNTQKVVDAFLDLYKEDGPRTSRFEERVRDFLDDLEGRFTYSIQPLRVLFKDGDHYWCE